MLVEKPKLSQVIWMSLLNPVIELRSQATSYIAKIQGSKWLRKNLTSCENDLICLVEWIRVYWTKTR